MALVLNNIIIESRESDNFVNATQLCKAGGKSFAKWYRLDSTKELIEELKQSLNVEVVDKKVGGNHSGSWIHPDLAVPLAQWISPKFAIQVSRWIREWRTFTPENEERYQKALTELVPSRNTLIEKMIQDRLKLEFNAQVEVETLAGRIDLETEEKIIEIKEISKWKHAIGQIMSYGTFSEKKKCIYLFGDRDSVNLEVIYKVCSGLDIEVLLD